MTSPVDAEIDRQTDTLVSLGYPALAGISEAEFRVLAVPSGPIYAVLDVEHGEEFCGVRPADAAVTIADRGRTPITMDEGLSLLHAAPDALEKNKCFHTAASRGTDKRVPALWISKNAPTLGWCWEHNHHTWLGVASAGGRVAA